MTTTAVDTLVLGIGNVVHSDDGAGVHAAKCLRELKEQFEGTTVMEGGTLGLELLPYLQSASRVLLLDAIDIGEKPGTIICLRGNAINGLKGSWSVHQLGVADLLSALRLVREEPPEVVILGVQPSTTDWGTELSAEVKAAIPGLVEAALKELRLWSGRRLGNGSPGAAVTLEHGVG